MKREVWWILWMGAVACGGEPRAKPETERDASLRETAEDAGELEPPGVDASLSEPVADAGSEPLDPTLMCDPNNEVLWSQTGASADGQVRYLLDRCSWNACAGGCAIGEVYFALTYGGRTDAAKGDDIAYTRTHHNWNDVLVATLPDRVLHWWVVLDENDINAVPKTFVKVESRTGTTLLSTTEVATSAQEWR